MKTVEIIVKKSYERPPLNTSGKYFKLYIWKDIEQKQINLNFKVKVPDNIINQIISTTLLQKQPVEICSEFLTTKSKYKEVILKLINKKIVLHLNFQRIQKFQGYIFYWARQKNWYSI